MITKVYRMLSSLELPLDYIKRPNFNENGIVLSYHFFDEGAELELEGEEDEMSGTVQIDIFSRERVDFTEVKKQVRQILKKSGFRSPESYDSQEYIDGEGFINHVVIRTNYLESEVNNS